jgi:hypothetical protein
MRERINEWGPQTADREMDDGWLTVDGGRTGFPACQTTDDGLQTAVAQAFQPVGRPPLSSKEREKTLCLCDLMIFTTKARRHEGSEVVQAVAILDGAGVIYLWHWVGIGVGE